MKRLRSVCRHENDSAIRWRGGLRVRDVRVRPTLDRCVIHVADWDRSNGSYRDVLGADVIDRGHDTWAYRLGAQQLDVLGPGCVRTAGADTGSPRQQRSILEWDDSIETAVSHLRKCGVEIEEGPVRRSGAKGSGVSVYFHDPDGSLLEFMTYVA